MSTFVFTIRKPDAKKPIIDPIFPPYLKKNFYAPEVNLLSQIRSYGRKILADPNYARQSILAKSIGTIY
tara:strand:- start:272 stop:478 length:207 start_codon:yes stop_codon:yes gene_type:complete